MAKAASAQEERLLHTVAEIIEKCGPRPAGSSGEQAAAQYISQRFNAAGLNIETQAFPVVKAQHLPAIISYSLLVLASITIVKSAPIAALFALIGLISLLLEINGTPIFSRLLPKRQSINILGKKGAPGSKRTLILVAHLDTSQPTLFSNPRVAVIQRQSFQFAINAAIIILVIAALGSISPATGIWWVAFAAGLYLIFHLTILVQGTLNMTPSPGANNNASGLAVLVELAEQLSAPKNSQIWFLACGGHETSLAGIRAFLRSYAPDPNNTFAINLDSLGAGKVTLTVAEGYLRGRSVSRRLLQHAVQVVRDEDLAVQAMPYQNEATETQALLAAGISSISIMAFDRRRAIPNWNWPSDTVERLDSSTLGTAAHLAQRLVEQVVKQGVTIQEESNDANT